MVGSFLRFAASDIHISLRAEQVTTLGPLKVTNAMIYGIICAVIIASILIYSRWRIKETPRKGFSQLVEVVIEYVINMLEGVFGSREKAAQYAPIFGSFFMFILLNNTLGLLPIVGPQLSVTYEGAHVPLLRPFTADLNGTIAMAVVAIIFVQILSIKAQGGKKHFQHYFTSKPLNPINLFIGILEVFGEFTRILSLSLRLFLNTAVGEILIAVFTSLVLSNGRTPLAVIPIILFELLVAGIQAYVFTVLTATYLGLAIAHADDDHGHDDTVHETIDAAKKVEASTS
jgi:F-type H+-transporting ATPase subunit a